MSGRWFLRLGCRLKWHAWSEMWRLGSPYWSAPRFCLRCDEGRAEYEAWRAKQN